MNICIFGDSTAWGAWDMEKGGWVNRLWFDFAERDSEVMLYNLSISGGTTETILERFEAEAMIREADVLIFQSGGNDCARIGDGRDYQVPIEKFETNVEEIIQRARKITDKVFFIGSEAVDESRSMPLYGAYYSNADIQKCNDVFKMVCQRNNAPFLDVFEVIGHEDLDDGVHPNARGHEKLFRVIKGFLTEHKII